MNMLKVTNLGKSYGSRVILQDINLTISPGEFVSIVGASGIGKSTLLHLIGLIDTFDYGEIYIKGEKVSQLKSKARANLRRTSISFILQNFGLIERKTVVQNLTIAQKIKGSSQLITIDEVLEELNIVEFKDKLPKQLSGGEKQRVAIARSLITNSDLLLLDEPTGNLDRVTSLKFQNQLIELQKKYKITVILVTHDLEFAQKADCQYELISSGKLMKVCK